MKASMYRRLRDIFRKHASDLRRERRIADHLEQQLNNEKRRADDLERRLKAVVKGYVVPERERDIIRLIIEVDRKQAYLCHDPAIIWKEAELQLRESLYKTLQHHE